VAASNDVWLISFASCSLVGVPLMLREGWSMGDLRRMVQEQERASEAVLFEDAEQHTGRPEESSR
jgi:hypothetical protein